MEAARMVASIWLQVDSINSGNSKLLMFFVGMVAVAMVTQAIVVIAAVIGAGKARKQLLGIAEEIRSKAVPVIDNAQNALHDLHPKIRTFTDNLVETSHIVRAKAQDFDETISEVNQKTRAQAARVDDMVTSVLDSTAHVASSLQRGVQAPVKEFSGVVAGVKAAVTTFLNSFGRSKRPAPFAARPWGAPETVAGTSYSASSASGAYETHRSRAEAYESYTAPPRAVPEDDIGY